MRVWLLHSRHMGYVHALSVSEGTVVFVADRREAALWETERKAVGLAKWLGVFFASAKVEVEGHDLLQLFTED